MKKSRIIVNLIVAMSALFSFGACTEMEEMDMHDSDYGHVQFKLYKSASYQPGTKAEASAHEIKDELDSLYEARKIQLTMMFEGRQLTQTLVFQPASVETADYGLRSDNLKLLAGTYKINSFVLYDKDDEPMYNSLETNLNGGEFKIVAGGLCVHELTADTQPRGKVKFTLVKDMSEVASKAISSEREYTFDEIRCFDVTMLNRSNSKTYSFKKLPVEFGIHFKDENSEDNPDFITSSSVCDSILVLDAGEYIIREIKVYDSDSNNATAIETQLEIPAFSKDEYIFTVADNKLTEAELPLTLKGTADYLQDYIALKKIWESLDGENWSYFGENFPKGANWNFDKDQDLWGDQPGVKLHNNGRVALIDISEFGFKGVLPAEIGMLTELVELYLGTHNDQNVYYGLNDNDLDPLVPHTYEVGAMSKNRMARNREYMRNIHPLTQLSGPSAFALKEKGKYIPEIMLYNKFTEKDIFDTKGRQKAIRPMDMNHGTICNGLESIDPAIKNCKKLETLYIANSTLSSLPDLSELDLLSNFEIYNCPKLEKISDVISGMGGLTQVNFANNRQWDAEESLAIIESLANGPSAETLQIFYFRQNNLEKMERATFEKFKGLGLLDLAYNRISGVAEGFGKDMSLEQIHLNNNMIESISDDFCGTDGVESISLAHNRITKFPNCFTAKAMYIMGSLDLSYNLLDDSSFTDEFKGISVNSLSLVENKLTTFPTAFTSTNSYIGTINLRGNQINSFPKEALDYTYYDPDEKGDPELGEWEDYDATYSNLALMSIIDLSYNRLNDLPQELSALTIPNLQSIDLSNNNFSKFPFEPFYCSALVVYAIRNQTYPADHPNPSKAGKRSLKEWPTNYAQHSGLRGLYLGGNDLGVIDDNISYICYNLEISDNPNITFDASDICWWWQNGMFTLLYDKTQNIIGCDAMLD